MAEGGGGQIPRSHLTEADREDKGTNKFKLKVRVALPNVKKEDVNVTYPTNKEDDLIVKIKDEVFYNERLPDTIVRDQCRIQGVRRRNGMTEIKILLVKEKNGLWLPRW